MARSTSTTTPAYAHPYDNLPHVILLDGKCYELARPYCGGNARGDRPYPFYAEPTGFVQHIHRVDYKSGKRYTDKDAFVFRPEHRELTDEEVEQIESGNARDVIQKKPVVRSDGEVAQVKENKDSKPSSVIIEHYPTVAQKDGTYITLACSFCEGNALVVRGARDAERKKPPRLVFIQGVQGLRSHIFQVHDVPNSDSNSLECLYERCGMPISRDRFNALRTNMGGVLISKVELVGEHSKWHKKGKGKGVMANLSVSETLQIERQAAQRRRPVSNEAEKTGPDGELVMYTVGRAMADNEQGRAASPSSPPSSTT